MVKDANDIKVALMNGEVRECFRYIQRVWPKQLGERAVAIFPAEGVEDKQEWSWKRKLKNGNEEVYNYHGWEDIFYASGLMKYKKGDLEVYCVLAEGGRNHVGDMEDVKIVCGVYRHDALLGEPLVFEDEYNVSYSGDAGVSNTDHEGRPLDKAKGSRKIKVLKENFRAIDKLKRALPKIKVVETLTRNVGVA